MVLQRGKYWKSKISKTKCCIFQVDFVDEAFISLEPDDFFNHFSNQVLVVL
ncbi:MAG: hypothetical protein ACJAQ4_000716 [Cryomorphaceae bacterium]|jgi:hypothetical protein